MQSFLVLIVSTLICSHLYGSELDKWNKLKVSEEKRLKFMKMIAGYQSRLSFEQRYQNSDVFYITQSEGVRSVRDIKKITVESCEFRVWFDDATSEAVQVQRPGLAGFQGVRLNPKSSLFFLKPIQTKYYWSLYNWKRVCRAVDRIEENALTEMIKAFLVLAGEDAGSSVTGPGDRHQYELSAQGQKILRLLTLNPNLLVPENFSLAMSFLFQAQLNPDLDLSLSQYFYKNLTSFETFSKNFSDAQNQKVKFIFRNFRTDENSEDDIVDFLKSENDFMLYLQMIRNFSGKPFPQAQQLTEVSQLRCFELLTLSIRYDSAKMLPFLKKISEPDHNNWSHRNLAERKNLFSPDGHRYRIMGYFLRGFQKKLMISIDHLSQPCFDSSQSSS